MLDRANPLASCLAAVLLSSLPACNCSEDPNGQDPDVGVPVCEPACAAGQVCKGTTCVKALTEGQVCGTAADGSLVEGACDTGLVCGYVSGTLRRCSKNCTSANAAEACGSARECFARPGGTTSGFCGTAAGEDQPCGDAELLKCVSTGLPLGLVCVNSGGETLGKCMRYCDPGRIEPNSDCASTTQSCADIFPTEPTRGICTVAVGHYPAKCDYGTLTFCGNHETCVRPGDDSWGYCHGTCTPSSPCKTEGQDCVQPSTGLYICAAPVARCTDADPANCAECTATKDLYCGGKDMCVRLGTAPSEYTVCKEDCTKTKTCASGTCSAITGTDRWVCL